MANKAAKPKRNGSAKNQPAKYAKTQGKVAKATDPYAPKLGDPIILCRRCGVWSARKNYCSQCLKPRPGFKTEDA